MNFRYHVFSFVYPIFGFRILGLAGSFKYLLARYRKGTRKLNLKGYPHPVFIRGKTSDTKLLFDILLYQDYPIPEKHPSFVVDGGANIGLFSVYFARHCPSAQIVAIEPEDSNFAMLEANTGNYPNVIRVRKGLWLETCRLGIVNKESEKWSFRLAKMEDGPIDAISMNDLFDLRSGDAAETLVKIDIEGADVEVFSGGLEWLSSVDNLYIEIHCSWREVFKAVEPLDYSVRLCRENHLFEIKRYPK